MVAELILSAVGDSTVDNTAAETTIFSGTVPAGTPGTDELLILRHIGDIRNDSGSAATCTLRCKYGGTTFHSMTTISLADAGATALYADMGTWFLGGENATNAQRSMYEHKQGGSGSGAGGYSGGNDNNVTVVSGTVDSTSSQTMELTAQLSAANTELEYRRRGVWVERWTTDDPSDGTAGTRVVNLDPSEVTVVNTVTETSVYSCTIPGGTIGTGNLLVARLCMDALNTSGVGRSWWTDVYWGGQHIFEATAGTSNASDAARRAFPIEVWIGGAGATNAQACAMVGQCISGHVGSGAGAVAAGTGAAANNSTNTATVDSTADQTLEVKVTMSTNLSTLEVRKLVGMVTVIKA